MKEEQVATVRGEAVIRLNKYRVGIYKVASTRVPSTCRSTGLNVNAPCTDQLLYSIRQRKLVDVKSIILTNMLRRSTAPHINKYSFHRKKKD
jgi:hypothetical protein